MNTSMEDKRKILKEFSRWLYLEKRKVVGIPKYILKDDNLAVEIENLDLLIEEYLSE